MDIDPLIVIYALGVAISFAALVITFYRWVYLPRSEKKRKKRIKELTKLTEQKQTFEDCKFDIEKTLKQVSEADFLSFSFVNLDYTFKLFSKVECFKEGFHALSDWLSACRTAIGVSLEEKAKKKLPTTLKEYNFVQLLKAEDIIQRFLCEEEVTKAWIEKTYPSLFHELMKNLKESEKNLNEFFIHINKTFREHRILKRFRKEKKNLIKLGKEININCNEEVRILESDISQYSDLEDEFETFLPISQ